MSLSTSWLCYVIYQLPPALGSMSSLPCRAVSSPTVNQYKLFLLQAIAHQLFGCINQKSNHYTRNSHPDWKKQTLRRRQQQASVTGENHRENMRMQRPCAGGRNTALSQMPEAEVWIHTDDVSRESWWEDGEVAAALWGGRQWLHWYRGRGRGKPEDQLEGSSRSQESFEPVSKLVYPRGSIDIICLRTGSPHLDILPVGLEED